MLVLVFILGAYWNKHLPSEVKKEGWTTSVIAQIAILAAVAAAGGMITIPGPATSIRLDSLAGYFGVLMFGWQVGAIVAAFGTFFANLMSGFSGWAALVPYYMINMALAVICFGIASKKAGKVVGLIVGTFVNTLCILPWVLMLGWAMMVTTLIPQILGSFVNALLAMIAYVAISNAKKHRKVEIADDESPENISAEKQHAESNIEQNAESGSTKNE